MNCSRFLRIIFRFLVIPGVILFLFACEKSVPGADGKPADSGERSPLDTAIYGLFDGNGGPFLYYSNLDELNRALYAQDLEFTPWVSAVRPVGFHFTGDKLFVSVNEMGIAEIGPGQKKTEDSPVSFEWPAINLYAGGRFFKNRVLGASFLFGDMIICQIFTDSVFSSYKNNTLPPLVVFSPDSGGFSPLKSSNPGSGWELVEINPRGTEWLQAWKSSREEISFLYSGYQPGEDAAVRLSPGEYRAALEPQHLDAAPETLKNLVEKSGLPDDPGILGAVRVFSEAGEVLPMYVTRELRELENGDVRLREIYSRRSSRGWVVLDPGENRFYLEGVSVPGELPRLPEGCSYTGFYIRDEQLVLAWEEQRFPFVRGSGLVFFNLPWAAG